MILFQLSYAEIQPEHIRANPKIKDQMDAVAFVINASMFDESLIEKLKKVREAANKKGTDN